MNNYILNESIFYDKRSNYIFFDQYTYVIPNKSGMIIHAPNENGADITYNPEKVSRKEAANIIRNLCLEHYNIDIRNVPCSFSIFD